MTFSQLWRQVEESKKDGHVTIILDATTGCVFMVLDGFVGVVYAGENGEYLVMPMISDSMEAIAVSMHWVTSPRQCFGRQNLGILPLTHAIIDPNNPFS